MVWRKHNENARTPVELLLLLFRPELGHWVCPKPAYEVGRPTHKPEPRHILGPRSSVGSLTVSMSSPKQSFLGLCWASILDCGPMMLKPGGMDVGSFGGFEVGSSLFVCSILLLLLILLLLSIPTEPFFS
ncbi:AT hook motif DNA-binding family protein [Striga asiatica]|uniref:AT hook motif DNA-binding family protein n=1 Tax=Striga asiatica TaxID=4170 RepID=A0A5A7Q9E1_STRAF|nr:AT hook motif DNA-binding family protein [Striga asiatica]